MCHGNTGTPVLKRATLKNKVAGLLKKQNKRDKRILQNVLTEVVFLFDQGWVDPTLPERRRPLLEA